MLAGVTKQGVEMIGQKSNEFENHCNLCDKYLFGSCFNYGMPIAKTIPNSKSMAKEVRGRHRF